MRQNHRALRHARSASPLDKLWARSGQAQGFTLIELLLVVVIIGILAAIVVPKFSGRAGDAQIGAAKTQISNLGSALDMYEGDNLRYPTTEQGLEALFNLPTAPPEPQKWKGPYLKADTVPPDPWGNAYQYETSSRGYSLWSMGPDGQTPTEDDIRE